MKKTAISLFKIFGILVLSLAGVVVVAIFVFAMVSEIIIPRSLIEKGLTYAPQDTKLSYEKIDLRFIKESINQKKFQFVLSKVCIDYKDKALDTCFDELSGGISFALFLPELVKVFPLKLTNAHVALDLNRLSSDEPNEEASTSNPLDFIRREILPKWDFPGTLVELKKIEVVTGEQKFVTSAYIDAKSDGPAALNLKVPDFREVVSGFPRANLEFLVAWPTDSNQNFESQGKFNLMPSKAQSIELDLQTQSPSWEDVTYSLNGKVSGVAPLRLVQLSGKYTPEKTAGLLSIQLGGQNSQIQQLNFINCEYALELNKQTGNLKCGPQQVKLAIKEHPTFRSRPAMFKFAPTFELKLTKLSYEKGFKTDYDFELELQHLNFMNAAVKLDGFIDATGEKLKYEAKANADVQVADFKRLVGFLEDTPAAIPAPVNVMSGKIGLDVDGFLNQAEGKFDFAFKPDLSSKHQRLLFTFNGKVLLENRAAGLHSKLILNSNLQDVKLTLPRLELKAPPQVLPDNRFNLAKVREREKLADAGSIESGSTFAYDVEVTTPQVGSIAVATNLTKNPIPIGLNLNANSESGVGPGEIEIGRVALELFRRKAFLEELDVEFHPSGEKFLKGNISIKYLDYDISIRVAGTTEEPKVIMESVPPLTQDQIISVLIFGKAPDELDDSQRSSVGNVSSAIADAALSFSSLYFLASTPVESVGYDAQRGVVTAKVGLGKGTSLELGSSGQAVSEVGVRRRLGQNWYLNSYVEEDAQSDERSVVAFLEWIRRF